tara:strand:- start:81 stop:830 length:750 start_codon:yes stop_codon:yes gene_type:complete
MSKEIANSIDKSHEAPSEVKNIVVDGAVVLDETLENNLHEFGYFQEQQSLETQSATLEMAQAVVDSVGLEPTFATWKAVRSAVLSGHVAFNDTLTTPRKSETLENKASLFMRLLENDFGFKKPKSQSTASVTKNNTKTKTADILKDKYDGSITVAEDQLTALNQLTPNLAWGTEEYKENEKEKRILHRVLNHAKKEETEKKKKAVSKYINKSDDVYRKIKTMIRKSGECSHANELLDALLKLEGNMNKE